MLSASPDVGSSVNMGFEQATSVAEFTEHLRQQDADLILYSGAITSPFDVELIEKCSDPDRNKTAYLVLLTYGGDPHVAYRIGRCLHRNYERVIVYAPGPCFSAGTLLAIAGHELVMSDFGLLGPLDIQIQKADELFETTSGLTVSEAMDAVRSEAWEMLEHTLLQLKLASVGQVTLKTALETATALTVGAIQPLFAQIDPMRLGEDTRSTRIIREYGRRLNRTGKNVRPLALRKLVSGYPSHRFVIDREEAETELFRSVRPPNEAERALIDRLGPVGLKPSEQPIVARFPLSNRQQSKEDKNAHQDSSQFPQRASRPDGSPPPGPSSGKNAEKGTLP